MYVNELRGGDGVGTAVVDSQGALKLLKKAMPVYDYQEHPKFKSLFHGQNRVIIGHSRSATRGSVNNMNCHPFVHGKIVGAHNGSLRGMHLLPNHTQFQVDSDAIFAAIESIGVAETALKLNGAWALTWFDGEDNTLHFWRNEERPFFYTFTKDKKAIFWASEPWMLAGCLSRNKIEHTELINTAPHNEYKISIPMIGGAEIEEVRVKAVKPYVQPIVTEYAGWDGYHGDGGYNRNKYYPTRNTPTQQLPAPSTEKPLVPAVRPQQTSFFGRKVTFSIESVISKNSALGLLLPSPATNDLPSHELKISSVPQGILKMFRTFPDGVFQGTLGGSDKKNDRITCFHMQGNSIKMIQSGAPREVLTLPADDVPPTETITVGDLVVDREEFEGIFAGCTCNLCGHDIQFEQGNTYEDEVVIGALPQVVCASCNEDLETLGLPSGNKSNVVPIK